MKELNSYELNDVHGGVVDFNMAAAGGALGGLISTGTLTGAGLGSALALAAGAAFAIGWGVGGVITENTEIDEWLGEVAFKLLH